MKGLPDGIVLLYPHAGLYVDEGGGEGGVQDAAVGAGGVVSGVTLCLSLHTGTPVQSSEHPSSSSTTGRSSHLQSAVTTATITTDHDLRGRSIITGLFQQITLGKFSHRSYRPIMDVFFLQLYNVCFQR